MHVVRQGFPPGDFQDENIDAIVSVRDLVSSNKKKKNRIKNISYQIIRQSSNASKFRSVYSLKKNAMLSASVFLSNWTYWSRPIIGHYKLAALHHFPWHHQHPIRGSKIVITNILLWHHEHPIRRLVTLPYIFFFSIFFFGGVRERVI